MFGAPLWLLGMLAGAGPIVIHFLNRQRFKRVAWAAMEWLLKALERNRRRMRVENLILLLVRVLILLLLALALAKPFVDSRGALAAAGGSRVCRIFVLDNSYSMGAKTEHGTPLERAKKAAAEVFEAAGGGDMATLVVTGSESAEVIPEPTTNLANVRERIETTELSHTDANLRAILTRVARRVAKLPHPRILIYVFSDMQRRNWLADGATDDDTLEKALEKIQRTAGVFLIDCAGEDLPNTAIGRIIVSADESGEAQGLVAAGVPVTVRARLDHFATDPREKVKVRLLIDGRAEKSETVDLDPRKPTTVSFGGVRFDKPGAHVVRVEIDGDVLAVDDTRDVAVDVDDAVRVLCVNGAPTSDLVNNETYFLERALAPQAFEFAPGISVFSVKTVTDVDFVTEDLDDYRLVVLANVCPVTTEARKRLERFVSAGGGLIVFLGDRVVEADAYNRELHAGGKGLLGARVLERQHFESITGAHARFVDKDSEHPVMVALRDRNVKVGVARVREYFYLDHDEDDENVSVLFRYDNRDGTPAAVAKQVGQGTAVLVSTSATRKWSTFPLSPAFLPFVQELAGYAARGGAGRRNLTVGEPIRLRLLASEFGADVTVTTPAKTRLTHLPEEDDEGYLFNFEKTRTAGMYTVEFGGDKDDMTYCVMPDTREGDLERATEDALRGVLGPDAFRFVSDPAALQAVLADAGAGASIWKTLIFIVLALLMTEALLARIFGARRGKVTAKG